MNPVGSGITLLEISALSRISGLEVLMEDTSFTIHMIPEETICNLQSANCFGVFTVDRMNDLKIINCTFAMNKQTALQAHCTLVGM